MGSTGSFLTGEYFCAFPGGDGDCVQCSQEIKDADAQQQPGKPDRNTDLVSRAAAGYPSTGWSGREMVELLLS